MIELIFKKQYDAMFRYLTDLLSLSCKLSESDLNQYKDF